MGNRSSLWVAKTTGRQELPTTLRRRDPFTARISGEIEIPICKGPIGMLWDGTHV